MKSFFCLLIVALTSCVGQNSLMQTINKTLLLAGEQYQILGDNMAGYPDMLPKTFEGDSLVVASASWWTSGFFPGTLWYLYGDSKNSKIHELALKYSNIVEGQKYTTDNHDVGFMIYCPFGNALQIEPKDGYKDIIIQASKSLATRFDPKVGLIRSWDFNKDRWQYPVIIDNMMNLEMLCAATELSGDSTYYNIAVSHADKTMEHHFREDMSCYHVISYDTLSGLPHAKETWQGLNNESEWTRGQAWALYGYTMMYRKTKQERYLQQAIKVAEYLINHPQMPSDMIPYWDFDDAAIPNAKRDASAAAVICSALLELSEYTNPQLSQKYIDVAKRQIETLCSPEYLAKKGEAAGFLLKHSVGSIPGGTEVDVPLTYADYYFVEAMIRYKKLASQGRDIIL